MATILISATEEYEKFAKGIAELLEFDFTSSIVNLNGKHNEFSNVALVVVILTENYNYKELLQSAIAKQLPLLFVCQDNSDSKPSTWFLQIANKSGNCHHFNKTHPTSDGLFNIGKFLTNVHSIIPLKSAARKDHKKRILLIGGVGAGKSTLTALIINGEVKLGMNPKDIVVCSGMEKATSATQSYSNNEYMVTDTMGLGYLESNDTMVAIENMYQYLSQNRHGYHAIWFLDDKKRVRSDVSQIFNVFYKSLFPDMAKSFSVVYTNRENDMELLERFPDPLQVGVKGVCTGIDMLYGLHDTTSQETLAILKDYIQNHTLEFPAVPELSWVSNNRFFNVIKGTAQSLSITLMDNAAEVLSRNVNKVVPK